MCNSWTVSTHVLFKVEDKFTHTFEVDDFQQVLAVFFLYLTNLNPLRNLHLDISHWNIPDRTDSYWNDWTNENSLNNGKCDLYP